jgi:hypothetical protein
MSMRESVTVHMAAPAEKIWALVSDVSNTSRYSEETFEAEWLDGATTPALGARFRGHVLRNGRPPAYWTVCRVTACEPASEFGFAVLAAGTPVTNWHYAFASNGEGTEVTETFTLEQTLLTRLYWALFGALRGRTNRENMRKTLDRIKVIVEQA